ncbi:MAG: caspase family protein [Parachlamydiaceae bacterium]|nr:caspase family protein [Parachlamydiaceae bacterium]
MLNRFKQTGITFFCTLVLGLCSAITPLDAATLHAVLVGDTNDQALGKAMKINIDNMHQELSRAADLTGLELNVVMTYGKSAKPQQVIKQIEQLEVNPDDVVIAFFSMHGYRTHDKSSQWPNLFFGEDYTGVELDYIVNSIREKNPRLLIALADSCNVYVNGGQIKTLDSPSALGAQYFMKSYEKQNYKKLFLDSSGVIIASGSLPGTSAWGVNNVGSFMTMGLLESLQEVVKRKSNAAWEDVFSQLEVRVGTYMKSYGSKIIQTPQYVIDLH